MTAEQANAEWKDLNTRALKARKELKAAIVKELRLDEGTSLLFVERYSCKDSPTGFHIELEEWDLYNQSYPSCLYCRTAPISYGVES